MAGLSPLDMWEGDWYIPLTIFGSCDHFVLAVWLSFTPPLFVGQLPWACGCCPCEYLGSV